VDQSYWMVTCRMHTTQPLDDSFQINCRYHVYHSQVYIVLLYLFAYRIGPKVMFINEMFDN